MVAVPHTDHGAPVERGRADELAVLYEIIHTVTSTLDLEAVLAAIVRLVNDAIVAHATYVFLAEEGGRRIVLRAASEQYAHLCGRVSMGAGEGIAGWVLENRQPVFINEDVLSDPRVKYFPELEEEKYQSLVSVPLVLKGDPKGEAEGGVLQQLLSDLEIECLVTDIPDVIRFNVSDLAIALGDVLLLGAVLLHAWTHRRELRQPI